MESDPANSDARRTRSEWIGWFALGLAILGGVPLFLCLPLWVDVTLYDLAARAVLRGGVHYRDVFDTNTPGIVWFHAVARSLFGWRPEALRAVDLGMVSATAVLLAGWVRKCGASRAVVVWFLAGVAWFYLFTSEFSHCQRDVWMLLPATVAGRMRLQRIGEPSWRWGIVEGAVWGLGVWIKPFVLVPAAAVWLASAVGILRQLGWKSLGRDFLAVFCGGMLAGLAGLGWLVESGTWPYFRDIFSSWNPEYASGTLAGVPGRVLDTPFYFPPWSWLVVLAIPVAIRQLVRAASSPTGLLSAFFLGWFAQALVLQRGFDYVHVPETILALAVLGARGWKPAILMLTWVAGVGLLWFFVDPRPGVSEDLRPAFARPPLANPATLRLWPRCWSAGSTPELRDRLGRLAPVHCKPEWVHLQRVAEFLRTVDPPLRDGELTCWHDSTHPLYMMLDLEPSTRYMHFGTVLAMRKHAAEVAGDVAASRQRYVVSDLRRITWDDDAPNAPGELDRPSLPEWVPDRFRDQFPWNQPVVFRSGRYVVHRIENPLGKIDIPDWADLGRYGAKR